MLNIILISIAISIGLITFTFIYTLYVTEQQNEINILKYRHDKNYVNGGNKKENGTSIL